MPPLTRVSLVLPLLFILYLFGIHLTFAAALLFFIFLWIIHLARLSPLANIPNAHWSSSFAPLWILWNRYRDREIQTVAKAFETKGPIVRLGPGEIAVNVIEGGIKTVHDGGFGKSQWYDCFVNFGVPNTFSSLGKDHATRRRRVSGMYSKAHIRSSRNVQIIMSNVLQACLPTIYKSADAKIPVDFLSLSFAYSIDFMTAMIFGLQQATTFVEDAEERKKWLTIYSKSHPPKSMFWMQELPDLTKWLIRIGVPVLPRSSRKAKEDLESWVLVMLDAAEQYLKEQADVVSTAADNQPTLHYHLKRALAKEFNEGKHGKPNTDQENQDQGKENQEKEPQEAEIDTKLQDSSGVRLILASECLDHIVATRDTFGISMANVLWRVSRHKEAQTRIRDELEKHIPKLMCPRSREGGGMAFLTSPETLDQLHYLNAVIKESLRLRNTAPTSNPRLTPGNKTTRIGPYDGIPGGVRISAFAWCLHRQEIVFDEAEEWNPDRWLSQDQDKLAEMNRWDWTFGSGSRMCLGRHLAWQLIQSTLAVIYTDFTTSVVDDQNFGRDGTFVMGKESDELIIQFNHDSILKSTRAERRS